VEIWAAFEKGIVEIPNLKINFELTHYLKVAECSRKYH